jgi:hypothetical protein
MAKRGLRRRDFSSLAALRLMAVFKTSFGPRKARPEAATFP